MLQQNERMQLDDMYWRLFKGFEDELRADRFLDDLQLTIPHMLFHNFETSRHERFNMPRKFHIFKLEGLRLKLAEWMNAYPVKLNMVTMDFIRKEMLKRYEPAKWQHPFSDVKIRNGALCQCGMKMTYTYGKFICPCGTISKEALFQGLHDYRVLYSEYITNKAFRTFFEVDNLQLVNKLFKRLGFPYEGSTKSRKYFIPADILNVANKAKAQKNARRTVDII